MSEARSGLGRSPGPRKLRRPAPRRPSRPGGGHAGGAPEKSGPPGQPAVVVRTDAPDRVKADLMVVVLDPERPLVDFEDGLAGRTVERARRAFHEQGLKRELFQSLGEASGVRNLLVFSTVLFQDYDPVERIKICAARAWACARDYRFREVAFLLNGAEGLALVGPAAEGLLLAAYRFDKYRREKPKGTGPTISVVVRAEDGPAAAAQLERQRVVCEEVNHCRDLINEPGGVVFPATLAEAARRVAARTGLGCTILDEKQLARAGYGGLLAVGRGSIHPPRMIVLRYRPPQGSRRHVALVGKGITFDSGGLSLKPPDGMQSMKGDMAGGAAVIHALAAVARLELPVRVTGIVPAAENLPGPDAQRPGDIFMAKNGKSVMVNNTDAEGRLVLTDGLARAGEERATDVVDIATLTQSCTAALGSAVAAVMGNDPELVGRVIRAGKEQGELFWELPLIREYRSMLKTPHADIKNVGGRTAGTIVAGLFLEEFVPEGVSWAHLDINGAFIVERSWKYYQEGATGFGLKTLVELCARFPEH